MQADVLWAKSWRPQDSPAPPRSAYFAEHLRDVLHAAELVLDSTEDEQLSALGLSSSDYRDRFRRIVLLAAAVHDLGKANDHFQGMILGKRDIRNNPQGLRHEWVTILMLRHLREWLLPAVKGEELDFIVAEWAVAGHHPGLNHPSPPRLCPPGAGAEIGLLMGHPDFHAALSWLQSALGGELGTPPELENEHLPLVGPKNVFQEITKWHSASRRVWSGLKSSPQYRLVPAVKNCLIAADVAGSALPKAGPDNSDLWQWIPNSFGQLPKPGDLQKVVDYRLDGATPREFQKLVANAKERVTLVKAGCGTGKTLAAYMRAAENHPQQRIYFCYPTTGTATEGFKDYLFPSEAGLGDLGARLFHSRRDIDFEIILSTGNDNGRSEFDELIRIEALEAWSTPIVACTVDTVLGLVQNNKRGLFAWPALAQSAFVFDEIHAFDDRLFGALLRFLRDLPGLPVLLMTASLPDARLEALQNVLEARGEILGQIDGPAELEERPRYHLATAGNEPLQAVADSLQAGGKVLWVCNTVKRVMEAADRAAELKLKPLVYHSRFRYEDRVARHKDVIDAFNGDGPALAICSQVAEMSLDLSACLLVTDLAPVPALIQRLGRLNRRAQEGDPTKPFIVVEPENHLPYTPPELEAARQWLQKLPAEGISQRHLATMWEQSSDDPPALVASAWLDGGPTTTVSELREASPGISVLFEADRQQVRDKPRSLGRYIVPMPPPPGGLDWKTWPKERGIPVVPADFISYDAKRGAEWRK